MGYTFHGLPCHKNPIWRHHHRRKTEDGKAYALTCPLITKADGSKFGKSESGNVWLDPNITSPYKFYQFWLNVSDEDAPKLIRVFTLKTQEEIEAIEKEQEEAPHLRALQKALAEEITIRVHGKEAYDKAVYASQILFNKKAVEELKTIDEDTLLSAFEGVPQFEVENNQLFGEGVSIADLLSELTNKEIFKSKGDARRMIKNGGLSINKIKVANGDEKVDFELLQGKYLLVQKGKKNYYLIKSI